MIRFGRRIPVTIRPAFWLFAALIGYLYSQSLLGTLIWIGIIFFSVLFHEFGHALTSIAFGKKPRIEIVALGGLTLHDGQNLSPWKQFLIVLNGPLFGLLLALMAWLALKIPILSAGLPGQILRDVAIINVFWTAVNLLPIVPLDGGQMLRIVMEAFFGAKGFQYSLVIGMGLSVLISLALFLFRDFLLGAFFFLFAFQSFEMWKSTRGLTDTDRQENLKELFLKAEEALLLGRKEEAIQQLLSLRIQAKKGLLWKTATQQLAVLYFQSGNRDESYSLLQEVQDDLNDEAAGALHELAFEKGNYALVVSLAPRVFRFSQAGSVALRSAYASAQLKLVKSAIGWLQAAIEEGESSISEALANTLFDPVRNDPDFTKFLNSLQK
jgi:Zn-dependent protease